MAQKMAVIRTAIVCTFAIVGEQYDLEVFGFPLLEVVWDPALKVGGCEVEG